jgi:hypothetical protein
MQSAKLLSRNTRHLHVLRIGGLRNNGSCTLYSYGVSPTNGRNLKIYMQQLTLLSRSSNLGGSHVLILINPLLMKCCHLVISKRDPRDPTVYNNLTGQRYRSTFSIALLISLEPDHHITLLHSCKTTFP